MIPKVIHYCWFGGKPLPPDAVKCIESWKKFFPDYEIKRWDESNFDVDIIKYTSEAYSIGKYAFVSDYARMWILYHHGGVYFDTDVEVIKPFDDILEKVGFMGFETPDYVNPGLGIALPAKSMVAEDIMMEFEGTQFLNPDGSFNPKGIVPITTSVLVKHGLKTNGETQKIDGITVYPIDWFNPFEDATGRLKKTGNTHSIHWYSKTWLPKQHPLRVKIARMVHRLLGNNFVSRIKESFVRRDV